MLIIFACGNATYILNTNRISGDEGDELYAESFTEGFGFADAILNQLIVSIGQGDMENYSKDGYSKDRNIVWFLFIFVSIFAQIVILNMLIAIMSDTFDKVTENRQLAALKLKVKVLSDFKFLIPSKAHKFIYLAVPKMTESAFGNNWDGKISEIKRS